MTPSIYFVAVTEGEDILKENLRKSYKDFFEYKDNFFLLRTNDSAEAVSDTLGIGTPAPIGGTVFEVSGSFYGRADKSFWNWLKTGDQVRFV